jgi:Flp pilus assembly protein TadB
MKKSKKNFMRLFIGLGVFVAGVAMLWLGLGLLSQL